MVMFDHVSQRGSDATRTEFDPQFHYLRVVVDNKVIFLASDTPSINGIGMSTVWYSAEREVLRFRDGRLIGAIGLTTEWRNVVMPEFPAWSELALIFEPVRWVRTRDVMPGYRLGVHDALVLKRIAPPSDSHLKGVDPHSLTWFEERLEIQRNNESVPQADVLPTARYAVNTRVDKGAVVYGEQCVSTNLCFSWQQWPAHTE